MGADDICAAGAKGPRPRRIAVPHAVPVALPPVLSLAGASVSLVIRNVVLMEQVFGIPGVYRLSPSR